MQKAVVTMTPCHQCGQTLCMKNFGMSDVFNDAIAKT